MPKSKYRKIRNAPGMGHFIETKTNETHSFNNFIVMQISAVLAIKTSTNNRRPYDFTQVLKFTSNNCIL